MSGDDGERCFDIAIGETVYYVNEYEVDRAYGGPEEGGWWYDTGRFIRCRGIYTESYLAKTRQLQIEEEEMPERRKGLRSPGSVLSTGEWPIVVYEDHPGRDYPRERPHYE